MKNKTVFVTDFDLNRLRNLLAKAEHWPGQDMESISRLKRKLETAKVTRQKEVPPYLVTMNCHVRVTDLNTKRDLDFWLAYPDESSFGSDKVSVLSDTGTAILGSKVGDVVKADGTDTKKQLRIAQIYYQPEDYKHYSL
jgi:regulator of nucleoside diphosphate kinase